MASTRATFGEGRRASGGEGVWGACTSLQLPPVIMAQFKLRMEAAEGEGGNCTPWWRRNVPTRGREPRFVFKYSIILFSSSSVSSGGKRLSVNLRPCGSLLVIPPGETSLFLGEKV